MAELESIGRIISRLANEQPERPAITHGDRTLTRAELDRSTNRLARAYEKLGVGQDDMVTVTLPNGIEFLEACIAVWKLGATPQPVSSRLPRPELEAIVELAAPSLAVGVPEGDFPGRTCLPHSFSPGAEISDAALPDRISTFWKAPTSGGSTGRPKIIVSNNPGAFDLDLLPPLLRMEPDRAQLVPGPLYHNGPFLSSILGLLNGNHLIVLDRFDALKTLEAMERWRVDWVMLVPTMMHRIFRLDQELRETRDLSALRVMLHLGAPCPPWLKEAWIDWIGAEHVHELYGGTEGQGFTWITGTEWMTHRGSVGKPATAFEIRILDKEGQTLPAGEVGEVYMMPETGPGSTYHYLGAEAKFRDGWESLGDMGWMDQEGYLYLTDRLNDMILSGGANIYPAEVEAALDAHPSVRSSCVIGLPDADLGERIHAIVDVEGEVTPEALREYVGNQLVSYKVPRTIELVQEPLRDDAGKMRRSALRKERLTVV